MANQPISKAEFERVYAGFTATLTAINAQLTELRAARGDSNGGEERAQREAPIRVPCGERNRAVIAGDLSSTKKYFECVREKKTVTEYTNECVKQELLKPDTKMKDIIVTEEALEEIDELTMLRIMSDDSEEESEVENEDGNQDDKYKKQLKENTDGKTEDESKKETDEKNNSTEETTGETVGDVLTKDNNSTDLFLAGSQAELLNETTTQDSTWKTQDSESKTEREAQKNTLSQKFCTTTAGPNLESVRKQVRPSKAGSLLLPCVGGRNESVVDFSQKEGLGEYCGSKLRRSLRFRESCVEQPDGLKLGALEKKPKAGVRTAKDSENLDKERVALRRSFRFLDKQINYKDADTKLDSVVEEICERDGGRSEQMVKRNKMKSVSPVGPEEELSEATKNESKEANAGKRKKNNAMAYKCRMVKILKVGYDVIHLHKHGPFKVNKVLHLEENSGSSSFEVEEIDVGAFRAPN
ncbi:unnamed protein product [Rhodiola kirilowii]